MISIQLVLPAMALAILPCNEHWATTQPVAMTQETMQHNDTQHITMTSETMRQNASQHTTMTSETMRLNAAQHTTMTSEMMRQNMVQLATMSTASMPAAVLPADSTVNAWFPFARFDSDLGFVGGGLWNRYHYIEGVSPYGSLTEYRAQVTSKGMLLGRITHDQLNAWGSNFRVEGELRIERLLFDNYFGMGNATEFNDTYWDDRWYNYESWSTELTFQARYPVYHGTERGQLDLLMLAGGYFYRAYEPDDTPTLLFTERQQVNNRPVVAYLGTGLLWDSRDNEIDPGYGFYFETNLQGYPGLGSGNGAMAIVESDIHGFYSFAFLDDLTVAARWAGEWATGDIPFWMYPELGGENAVRGLHLRRFRDRAMMFNSLALRKWLASFDFMNIRLGLQAFTESGRVFGSGDTFSDLFRDYHRTFGGSLLLSAFFEDFFVRADYARFEGDGRIYINIGFVY